MRKTSSLYFTNVDRQHALLVAIAQTLMIPPYSLEIGNSEQSLRKSVLLYYHMYHMYHMTQFGKR